MQIIDFDLQHHLRATEDMILSQASLSEVPLTKFITNHIVGAGGKRIRPQLCLMMGEIFGGINQKHYYAATAIEFIHTATLLHDDVLDGGKKRRGEKTANILWGNKAAILAGDHLFARAFSLLVKTEDIPSLDSLSKTSEILAEGEILQLSLQNKIPNHDEYFKIIYAKTASLFGAACKSGAFISGAGINKANIVEKFGINFGNIFQITDDIIDYNNSDKTGKSNYNDFFEGKYTLPLILLNQDLKKLEQDSLYKIMSVNHLRDDDDLSFVLELMEKYDVLKKARIYCEEIYRENQNILTKLPNNHITNELKQISKNILERNI